MYNNYCINFYILSYCISHMDKIPIKEITLKDISKNDGMSMTMKPVLDKINEIIKHINTS